MLFSIEAGACACGHELRLHDAHGCAAFLGAYPDTAWLKRYCPCRAPRGARREAFRAAAAPDGDVVGVVRLIREDAGEERIELLR
jgi:hypothetical protein